MDKCRCDGTPMNGSDHCPDCFCEQFEERCHRADGMCHRACWDAAVAEWEAARR